jgi:hypothetical protein
MMQVHISLTRIECVEGNGRGIITPIYTCLMSQFKKLSI